MINVVEMIRKELVEMGADGLVNEEYECGCSLNDLMPCGNVHETNCRAAKNNAAIAQAEQLEFWMEEM